MLTHFILFLKVHIEFLDAGDVIKIEGPPTDADKAREILEEHAKELMTKMDFTEINVDAKYHKHIIGKGGLTVNKLKQETEVMINIPDSDKAPSNVIHIEGNEDGVKKAKKVSSIHFKILNFCGKKNRAKYFWDSSHILCHKHVFESVIIF